MFASEDNEKTLECDQFITTIHHSPTNNKSMLPPATLLVAELEETRDVPEALLAKLTPTGTIDKLVAAFRSPSKRLLRRIKNYIT